MNDHLLTMRGIGKAFPGVQALDEVDLSIRPGEVHALLGENGAGKSTLIKVLTGIHQPDAGRIVFADHPFAPADTAQSQCAGISTIYQELNLIPYLSIGENIFLGREPKRCGLIDWKAIKRRSSEILRRMGLVDVDVNEALHRHSVAVQQMVAIARAALIAANLLVMDEPTSSLSEKEVETLFRVVDNLKMQGIAVLFISHKLDEVFAICDRATILRDGRLVGEYAVDELTHLKLVSLMIGHNAASVLERKKDASNRPERRDVILTAKNLSKPPRTREISIDVKSGEILGVAGLLGSGRTELAMILFGDDTHDRGQIDVADRPVHFRSPRDAIRLGFGFCSEDRKGEGIFPNMSVMDNMTMAILPELRNKGFLSGNAQRQIAETYIAKLNIAATGPHQTMKQLSGGNQQKVLLARWLCKNPILMILDEPTRGIDVGGKSEIEAIINELAGGGVAVLMISSEMEELIRSCDRIAVLSEGTKVGELAADAISEQAIVDMLALGRRPRETAHAR